MVCLQEHQGELRQGFLVHPGLGFLDLEGEQIQEFMGHFHLLEELGTGTLVGGELVQHDDAVLPEPFQKPLQQIILGDSLTLLRHDSDSFLIFRPPRRGIRGSGHRWTLKIPADFRLQM